MSPLPEVLKIGPYRWSVYITKEAWRKAKHEDDVVGVTDFEKMAIFIKPDLDLQYERATVLHEVMHACFRSTGQTIDLNDAEESFINTIDGMLLAVLNDNPELLDYFGLGYDDVD